MRLTNLLKWFLCLALGLPMLVLVVQFAGLLLAAMEDEPGAAVLRGVAIAGGVLWVLALLGLIILVAVEMINRE